MGQRRHIHAHAFFGMPQAAIGLCTVTPTREMGKWERGRGNLPKNIV